jgi:hypothetical protein
MTPIRLLALLSLFPTSLLLAQQQPAADAGATPHLVGIERAVSPIEIGASNSLHRFGTARMSAAASNGSELLAVWQDNRSGQANDLYATRVSSSGTLLDPRALRVTDTILMEENPYVAWNGLNWVLAWSGVSLADGQHRLYSNAVSALGQLVNASANEITNNGELRGIASSGSVTAVLVSTEAPGNPAASTTQVFTLDTEGFTQRSSFINQGPDVAAIAPRSGGFYVALSRFDMASQTVTISGMRLNASGATLDPAPVPLVTIPGQDRPISLVAGQVGNDIVIVGGRTSLTIVRVFAGGSTRVTGAAANDSEELTDLLGRADGSFSLASTWTPAGATAGHLLVRRVSDTDNVMFTRELLPPPAGPATLAEIAGRNYAAWPSGSPGVSEGVNLLGSLYDFTDNPTILSRSGASQQAPAVAASGQDALIAWSETRAADGNDSVFIRPATIDGVPAGNPVQVSLATTDAASPAVTFTGSGYLVAWQEVREVTDERYTTLLLRRVSRAGLPDNEEILVTRQANEFAAPKLAGDGINALLVWSNGSFANPLAFGALVTPTGVRQAVPIGGSRNVTVASNGANYLAAAAGSGSIVATVVSLSGAVLSVGAVTSPGPFTDANPAVASNGNEYLLAWTRNGDVLARLFDRNGNPAGPELGLTYEPLLDPPPLNNAHSPSVAWDGSAWLVSWTRTSDFTDTSTGNVISRRISSTGERLGDIFISTSGSDERSVALAPLARGKLLAAYTRATLEAEDVPRVFTRTITIVQGPSRRRAVRH